MVASFFSFASEALLLCSCAELRTVSWRRCTDPPVQNVRDAQFALSNAQFFDPNAQFWSLLMIVQSARWHMSEPRKRPVVNVEQRMAFLWGDGYAERKGDYLLLPIDVVGRLRRLGLSDGEALLVLAINSHRFYGNDELPRPGTERLGELLGVSHTTVLRTARRLERRGLISLGGGQKGGSGKSHHYDLGPLLTALADQVAAEGEVPAPAQSAAGTAEGPARTNRPVDKEVEDLERRLETEADPDVREQLLRRLVFIEEHGQPDTAAHDLVSP